MLRVLVSRLRGTLFGGRHDRDLADEIRAHLELLAAEHMRRGLTPAQAAAAARREFGGVDQTADACRDRRGLPLVEAFAHDIRGSLRHLRKNPRFGAAAVLTLALGIGASTAIFSLVDAVLLRPLPYADPDRLVVVHESVRALQDIPVNAMHFLAWQANTRSFDGMALIREITVNLSGWGEPELVPAARASPSLFSLLGTRMQLGRSFLAEEDEEGRDRVLILDDALWRRRFGADPTVIGRTIRVDGETFEIVGVLPRDFRFPSLRHLMPLLTTAERAQAWKPYGLRQSERNPVGAFNNICVARLKPGVSLAQASQELEQEQASVAAGLPQKIDLHASVVPLHTQVVGRSREGLGLLVAAVWTVLLIGCINVANLLLVKTLGRQREFAVRRALGASRGRLMRQMFAESLTLCVLGGVGGVLVGCALLRVLLDVAPSDVPRLDEVGLNGRALAFALAASATVAFVIGLLPAWRSSGVELVDAMKVRAGSPSRRAGRARAWLVGAEIGLSAACLIVGGLLLQSVSRLARVEKGFDVNRLVTATVRLAEARYPTIDDRAAFQRAALDRLRALPGVAEVAISNQLPLRGVGATSALNLEGTTLPLLERPIADVRSVNPEFFRAWSIPLRAGRLLEVADGDRRVAVVSEFTARQAWPGRDPIGQRLSFGAAPDGLFEVIGIVSDVRGISLDRAPSFAVYVPYWQRGTQFVSLAIKTAIEPTALASAVRAAIHGLDPDMPVSAIRTMEDVVTESTAERRFQRDVVVIFAAAAVLLASFGIYGTLSHTVVLRTNEIGIRLALGARPGAVRGLVVGNALRLVAAGLAAGVPLGIAVTSALGALLYGVSPRDPMTIAAVCVLLALAGWLASWVPARRAARVDPILALRVE